MLAGARRRTGARIRVASLAKITEAREDKRSLYFPCSGHLRSMWRRGELRARDAEYAEEAKAARELERVLLLEQQRRQEIVDAQVAQQAQEAAQVAREKLTVVRAYLADVRCRQTGYIRGTALADIKGAREDRRSLYFPCSAQRRRLWRQRQLAPRACA